MIDERNLIRHLEEGGDDLWNPAEPPPLDLAAITGAPSTAGAAPASRPGRAERTSRWRSWLRPRAFTLPPLGLAGGALACVGAGLVIGAAAFQGSDGVTPSPKTQAAGPTTALSRFVSLERLADAPATAMAVASVFKSADGDSIDVRVSGLPKVDRGTYYELWALGTKGRMVSLGTIAVDESGRGEASLPLPVSLNRFPVLDISVEPTDGNPAHSGESLLRAPA